MLLIKKELKYLYQFIWLQLHLCSVSKHEQKLSKEKETVADRIKHVFYKLDFKDIIFA